jgi:hypothetical protein
MKVCYHIPVNARWQVEPSSEERVRLERAITLAIERAVKSKAQQGAEIVSTEDQGLEGRERFDFSRFKPQTGAYSLPSYDAGGAPRDVPVVDSDQVIDDSPPFNGALVMHLPGGNYYHIQSHRYARTPDIVHATVWGQLLFGTTTWAIASKPQRGGGLVYYVAGFEEALTEADLRVHPFDPKDPKAPKISGATGSFSGRVLASIPGGYKIESVYFPDGGRTAATRAAFVDFGERLATARKQPGPPIDIATVRASVFRNIDAFLARGGSDNLEKAAELLSQLNATAFRLLDSQTRIQYLKALVKAWTSDPQEKAIVEIFKSVSDRSELTTVIEALRKADLWEQLFDDLDSELWSLLVTLGRRFGDPGPFGFGQLIKLLLEAKLISPIPGIRLTDKGAEISLDVIAETYEAARSFIRFIGGFFESLLMFITHPQKIVDGLGQLAKMALTVQLAQLGDEESIKEINDALAGIGAQVLYALKGVAVTGMGAAVERRVKWALVWEVASWFVGVGEIQAGVRALGVSARVGELGRLLRILGLAGKAAEGERVAVKIESLASLAVKSSKVFTREEEVLRVLSRLPEEDVVRLGKGLERVEITGAGSLARVTEGNADIGSALQKAESLHIFAGKAGGLTDDVVEAFGNLSRRLEPFEINGLSHVVPPGQGRRFAQTIRRIPPTAFGPGGAATPEFLIALAESPQRMEAMSRMGYETFAAVFRRAEGDARKMDQYLSALADLEATLPPTNRAVEYRRLLDQVERGDADVLLQLEDARAAKFAPAEARLDPKTIEKWIDEELDKLGPVPPAGTQPVQIPGTTPRPAPAGSFSEALSRVDLSTLTPAERARLQAGWKRYSGRASRRLQSEDEYIRFVHGKRSGQLPAVTSGPRDLGATGAIEQQGGHILQRVVDEHLPAASRNARDIPTSFGNTRPDHLPPGTRTIYLNPDGTVSATNTGTPFSARFVGDSKYRNAIPTSDQTRGFVRLAQLSDEKRLVFYVRWQEHFPATSTLLRELEVGYTLPERLVPEIVGAGVREEARSAGVAIDLVSDPMWR